MLFNLNEFLGSISFALDFVEIDLLGVKSNHGKRTAYISLKVAEELGFSSEELHDIVALSILHDNGVSEKSLHDKLHDNNSNIINELERLKEHCTIGETNSIPYPFLTNVKDAIKYHHEKYNGTGFFGLRGNETPLMAQIISLADTIELAFNLQNADKKSQEEIFQFVTSNSGKLFSKELVHAFCNVSKNNKFWINLTDKFITSALINETPKYIKDVHFEEIRKITGVLSKIIDSKSNYTRRHSRDLCEKVSILADFYKMPSNEKIQLMIAADLHDIGKLAVPNLILDSPNALSKDDFEIIKDHPYYTRVALQPIKGFELITEWASNHHEKLNGTGYPFGKTAADLDFNSRLMGCLDIYEALTEERPYRRSLSHNEAMEILNQMKNNGLIDAKITNDIDFVFGHSSD